MLVGLVAEALEERGSVVGRESAPELSGVVVVGFVMIITSN